MRPAVYMDHNASTPVRPEVIEAVGESLLIGANPSSVHEQGRRARAAIERARDKVAALAGAPGMTVIFTSGGTEANNQVLKGFQRRQPVYSAIEHPSVREAVPTAEVIAVHGDGTVNLEFLAEILNGLRQPGLVSVMLANNETGAIQPLKDIVAIAHARGALVHTDAVQAAGKIPVDFADLGVDLMSISAHKIGGPQDIGAIIAKPNLNLRPLLGGGGQERGLRGGTENVPGIVGFGVAAGSAAKEIDLYAGVGALRNELERRILEISPKSRIFGATADRLPNTSCFTMPGVTSETQVMALDLDGFMISAGAACSSGKVRASRILVAMGEPPTEAATAIRVSLSPANNIDEIDAFAATWTALLGRASSQPQIINQAASAA